MIIPDLTPRYQLVPPPQAAHIRSTCTRWGYPALLACVANGVLLAYYLSRPQASLRTIGSGGLSVLFCFLASFTLARCRSSVPNGYLNLTDARFTRRLPWVLWAFSIPLTSVSLMPVAVSHHGRFGTGWGLALYVLTLVFPVLLTTVVAVRCVPHTLELVEPHRGRRVRSRGALSGRRSPVPRERGSPRP